MATYQVTGPDGQQYEVTGPDNATDEEVLNQVQAYIKVPDHNDVFNEKRDALQTTGKVPPMRPWLSDAEIEEGVDVGKRVLQGVADPIHGGAQLLSHLVPQGIADVAQAADQWLYDKSAGWLGHNQGIDADLAAREKAYQATQAPEGFDWSRAVGNVISGFAPIPGASGRSLLGLVTGGALGGLATPVTDTTDESYAAQKAKQAATGAAAGAILKAVLPHADVSDEAKLLMDKEVNPTIGQTFGGLTNWLEQKATSVPFMGDAIRAARAKARDQFNVATVQQALDPIGGKASGNVGTDMVDAAYNTISDAYAKGLKNVPSFSIDKSTIIHKIESKQGNPLATMTPTAKREFDGILNGLHDKDGTLSFVDGEHFKRFDSEIGAYIRQYSSSPMASDKQIGKALKQYQAAVREQPLKIPRLHPPGAESTDYNIPTIADSEISAANQAYARLNTIKDASVKAALNDGVFTPGQLLNAVKKNDYTAGKQATGRGNAFGQDWAIAGQKVLGDTYPDSGTAGRLLQAGGLGSILGAITGHVSPTIPAGFMLGAGMYQPLVQKAIIEYMQAGYPLVDAIKLATAKAAPQTLTRKEARAK